MNEQAALLLETVHFAADKHRNQRRKDADGTPYINHPIGEYDALHYDAFTRCSYLCKPYTATGPVRERIMHMWNTHSSVIWMTLTLLRPSCVCIMLVNGSLSSPDLLYFWHQLKIARALVDFLPSHNHISAFVLLRSSKNPQPWGRRHRHQGVTGKFLSGYSSEKTLNYCISCVTELVCYVFPEGCSASWHSGGHRHHSCRARSKVWSHRGSYRPGGDGRQKSGQTGAEASAGGTRASLQPRSQTSQTGR